MSAAPLPADHGQDAPQGGRTEQPSRLCDSTWNWQTTGRGAFGRGAARDDRPST